MFQTIRNAFKTPDLRKKLIYTILILIVFRLGSTMIIPFVDAAALSKVIGDSTNFFGLLNTFSGGAFGNATLFALSISPYITAQIIIQLLTVAIPPLERMAKEGETGRKKLDKIIRYTTIGMSLLQGYGYYLLVRTSGGLAAEFTKGWQQYFVASIIILVLTAGAMTVVWMGDRISEKGIGNGISLLLFAGIIAGFPSQAQILIEAFKVGGINYFLVPFVLLVFAAMIVFIVVITQAERRIPIQYAKRVVGRKMYGGQSSFFPVKVNMSGVMPIIFASSLLSLPATILTFVPVKAGGFWSGFQQVMSPSHWVYGILYFLLIIAFNYFYVAMQYNPIEIANNIKNNNGAIPGIRPGKPTSTFIGKVISKITFIGALCLGIIAVFPSVFTFLTKIQVALGGTTIIIVVGVALDTMRQMESELMMRHHKGFLE